MYQQLQLQQVNGKEKGERNKQRVEKIICFPSVTPVLNNQFLCVLFAAVLKNTFRDCTQCFAMCFNATNMWGSP